MIFSYNLHMKKYFFKYPLSIGKYIPFVAIVRALFVEQCW
jgi:hypothetical protein